MLTWVSFPPLKTPLKRASLPTAISWNGKCGKDFEQFIDQFTGHVNMQPHMGYLLLDTIAVLWLLHGNATTVLTIGIQQKLHPSLVNITPEQFLTDVAWLFGGLQQAINNQGRNIVHTHERSQDGILCWQ